MRVEATAEELVTIMALYCTALQRVLDYVISIQLVGMIVICFPSFYFLIW